MKIGIHEFKFMIFLVFIYIYAIVDLFFENRYYIEGEGYFEQSISLMHVICL
jgi:hypothetical protein